MNADEEIPSRSALKREDQARQKLAERLVELTDEELAQIPLGEELAAAVALARRISERGGRRRQLRYIGKLARGIDTAAVERALTSIDSGHRNDVAAFHCAEHWRERLLQQGAAAIEALALEQPVDRTRLTALVQEAAAEARAHQPPRAARALFRYLRDEVFASKTDNLR